MKHPESRRLKRLATLGKALDTTMKKAMKTIQSCGNTLRKGRRAELLDLGEVQVTNRRRKKTP